MVNRLSFIRRTAALLSAVSIVAVPVPGTSASIGLFSSADCNSCNLGVLPGGMATFYIRALTEGIGPETGFTGAGLRVTGLPSGWSTLSVPNPQATLSAGDPFSPGGARIAFSSHIAGTCIDLYTVSLTINTSANEATLRVEGVASPWNPTLICPFIVPGCSPCDFVICVDGGRFFVNSGLDCDVSSKSAIWTHIKALYR